MSGREEILRPLGLATILAVGFAVVIAVVLGFCGSVIPERPGAEGWVLERLMVQSDGTPLIWRFTFAGYQSESFHTLEGKKVPRPKYESRLSGASLLGRPRSWMGPFFEVPRNRVMGFSDQRRPPIFWYFVHDGVLEGRGHFVGFESKSKLCIGYLGRKGFQSDTPPAEECFPVDGRKMASGAAFFPHMAPSGGQQLLVVEDEADARPRLWKVHLISGDQLLEIDLRSRSVATLMESADLLSLGVVEAAPEVGEEPKRAERPLDHLAVRTADRIVVFDAAGKQCGAYLVPEDLRRPPVDFYNLGGGRALLTTWRRYPDHSSREELTWIDQSGKILRRQEVALTPRSAPFNERAQAWKTTILPAPIALAISATVVGPFQHLDVGVEPDYASALRRSLLAQWPPLVAVLLLAAVLAWFCYRRHQRFALPWGGLWVTFVFILGVPGLLAYRFHRRWPVLEACPACKQDVPHDREACSHCGSEFPRPEPKGTEVFA